MSAESVRTPESFRYSQLLAQDFDGTIALTGEKCPGIVGVEEAYVYAVEQVFGTSVLCDYIQSGGLQNRAPLEIVRQLAPDAVDPTEANALTDRLNTSKLELLTGQIGTVLPNGQLWPRLTPGYERVVQAIASARKDGRLIDDIVITSGHAAFINKTFSVHGLEQPRLMLAEETVRGLELNVPAEELVKPSPLLMKLGAIMWRASYGDNRSTDMTYDEKQRTIYVGDDPSKDGEFAAQSGVRFQQICSDKRDISWLNVIHQLRISSYDKASV